MSRRFQIFSYFRTPIPGCLSSTLVSEALNKVRIVATKGVGDDEAYLPSLLILLCLAAQSGFFLLNLLILFHVLSLLLLCFCLDSPAIPRFNHGAKKC